MDVPDVANLGAAAVIAVFAIKEFFTYLNKKSNGNGASGVLKLDLGPLDRKLDTLLKSSEGARNSDWWELTLARIFKQCMDDHENRIRRPVIEEAAQSRSEIIEGQKQLERQIALAVAELSRQIRERS